MDRAEQLTWAVSVTQQLVEAIERRAVSDDLAAFAAATVGVDQLDEAPERLRRATLPNAPNIAIGPDLARMLLMSDWVDPIHQAIVTGYPVAPVAARPLDAPATALLSGTAYRLGEAAKRAGDWAAATEWWRLAVRTGHPRAAKALRKVEGRTPRPWWLRLAAWSAVPVLLVAGVVWLVLRPDRRELPATVDALVPACEGALYPDAPAYAGDAPHPTVVFDTTPNTDLGSRDFVILGDRTLSAAWRPDDPGQVQAVACVNSLDTAATIKTCYYTPVYVLGGGSGMPFAMVERRYRVTVFSLREHRQLARVEFVGVDDRCPETVLADGPHQVDTSPTAAQFAGAIGRWVDG